LVLVLFGFFFYLVLILCYFSEKKISKFVQYPMLFL
jgi:hypothetical protein